MNEHTRKIYLSEHFHICLDTQFLQVAGRFTCTCPRQFLLVLDKMIICFFEPCLIGMPLSCFSMFFFFCFLLERGLGGSDKKKLMITNPPSSFKQGTKLLSGSIDHRIYCELPYQGSKSSVLRPGLGSLSSCPRPRGLRTAILCPHTVLILMPLNNPKSSSSSSRTARIPLSS